VEAYFYWPGDGTCINELYADTILAAFNTFSELVVAALPIPIVFRLKMSPTQRWSVLSLISLGFLVTVVGSVRTYYVWVLFSSDDLTWWSGPHWICSEVEICVAMVRNIIFPPFSYLYGDSNNSVQICACAPALRPMIGRLFSSQRPIVSELTRNPFSKEREPTISSDSTISPFGTRAETMCYHTFDLEGIAVDSYGYVVTITAENGERQRTKSRKYWSFSRKDIEKSMRSASRSAFRQRGASMNEKPVIEIVTTRSLEMRESFYEDRDNRMSHE
jgi:hypothetical protein